LNDQRIPFVFRPDNLNFSWSRSLSREKIVLCILLTGETPAGFAFPPQFFDAPALAYPALSFIVTLLFIFGIGRLGISGHAPSP